MLRIFHKSQTWQWPSRRRSTQKRCRSTSSCKICSNGKSSICRWISHYPEICRICVQKIWKPCTVFSQSGDPPGVWHLIYLWWAARCTRSPRQVIGGSVCWTQQLKLEDLLVAGCACLKASLELARINRSKSGAFDYLSFLCKQHQKGLFFGWSPFWLLNTLSWPCFVLFLLLKRGGGVVGVGSVN